MVTVIVGSQSRSIHSSSSYTGSSSPHSRCSYRASLRRHDTSHFNEHSEEVDIGTHLGGETPEIAVVEVGKKLVPQDFRVAKDKQIIYIDKDVHDSCSVNEVEQSFIFGARLETMFVKRIG